MFSTSVLVQCILNLFLQKRHMTADMIRHFLWYTMICLFQQLNQIALVLTSVRTFSVLNLLMGWHPSEVKGTKILSYRGKFVIKGKEI